jgi:adenylyltransferase/sulfurtransferase
VTLQYPLAEADINIDVPFPDILANPSSLHGEEIIFICRRGNDSLVAARKLRSSGFTGRVRDVKGGIEAWSRDVDQSFPSY